VQSGVEEGLTEEGLTHTLVH